MSRNVLVVDDSMLIRHTVCRYLEGIGYSVEAATNGQEALDLLQDGEYRPDLIVTDMQMPKVTGSELITALKDKPATRAIPIVVLAGKKASTDGPQETRAEYIIYKDIDIEAQLKKALATALSGAAR
jgi:two-component system, chemotaxis family, chemotaxis protein CheY